MILKWMRWVIVGVLMVYASVAVYIAAFADPTLKTHIVRNYVWLILAVPPILTGFAVAIGRSTERAGRGPT